jgi:hypothetical protein
MGINPANPAPVKPAITNELDDGIVRDDGGLMHLFVVRKQLPAAARVSDQEFSKNERMTTDLFTAQEPVELRGMWRAIR